MYHTRISYPELKNKGIAQKDQGKNNFYYLYRHFFDNFEM